MRASDAFAAATPIAGGFALDLPERWAQGRTNYGGFSTVLAYLAAKSLADDLPPLRSAQVSFIGPLAVRAEVRARLVRRGRNAAWITCEISCDSAVGFVATMVFMSRVDSHVEVEDCPLPSGLIPLDEASLVERVTGPQVIPRCFEQRHALKQVIAADVCWWVRTRERENFDPVAQLLLVADSLPPAVTPLLAHQVPASSLNWHINLLSEEPVTPDGWWILRAGAAYARNGVSSQNMTVWNSAGQAVASGMQAMAIFG